MCELGGQLHRYHAKMMGQVHENERVHQKVH